IQAKFDAMIDAQKVFAADALSNAKTKVEKSGREITSKPKAKVLIPAIENASLETDDGLRDIWANLIANEMLDGEVHPEFPIVLSRLSSNDAIVLAEIASSNQKDNVKIAAKALNVSIKILGIDVSQLLDEPADFSREHLERLNLITKVQGKWVLTYFGEEFVKSVTDPNFSS
ncbi:MAG: Abi-alpha family protein, partial [Verrucomicrobiota bacterium]